MRSKIDTDTVYLNSCCDCKICLTISDIIDISFVPVLQDIACTLSASLLNTELFGDYMNIDYLFTLIHFSNNPLLQHAFIKILEEEADDYNLELGIDTSCLVIPELYSSFLQPILTERPFWYKTFQIGALQQVCSENYAFHIDQKRCIEMSPVYKNKITEATTILCDNVLFPLLNKGDIINNGQLCKTFYMRNNSSCTFDVLDIGNVVRNITKC